MTKAIFDPRPLPLFWCSLRDQLRSEVTERVYHELVLELYWAWMSTAVSAYWELVSDWERSG